MGKLEDLRVERVDGVDRPATSHRWIMLKSEDSVEKDSATLAKTALEALVKEEGLSLSGETVEALKALAAALEIDVTFEKAEEPEAPEADVEKDEAPEADEEVEKDDEAEDGPTFDPTDPEQFAAVVEKIMDARIAREVNDMPEAATTTRLGLVTKSKQVEPEREEIAKGTGLYDNVIFGQ